MNKASVENSKYYKCYVPVYNAGSDFVIFEIGSEKCEPLHYWGPHVKQGYVFHYCNSGKGILKIGDKTYHIKAGDLFYIAPDDKCFYQADSEDSWQYRWIYFGGMKAKNLILKTAFYDSLRVVPCKNCAELTDIIDSMMDKKASEVSDMQAMSALYRFFAWLIMNYPNADRQRTVKPNEKYWQQILNYICVNFPYNLSINKIAKSIGLERTYVYKLFMKNAGVSAMTFVENLRISIACDKIKETEKSLLTISEEVGFNDYAWFTKLFKRTVGVLPGEYLEKYDEIKSEPSFKIVQNRAKDYYNFFNKN